MLEGQSRMDISRDDGKNKPQHRKL